MGLVISTVISNIQENDELVDDKPKALKRIRVLTNRLWNKTSKSGSYKDFCRVVYKEFEERESKILEACIIEHIKDVTIREKDLRQQLMVEWETKPYLRNVYSSEIDYCLDMINNHRWIPIRMRSDGLQRKAERLERLERELIERDEKLKLVLKDATLT